MFILKVGRENLELAQSSLLLMNKAGESDSDSTVVTDGYECRVRILHVGGTLEKVESRYKTMSEAWMETN